MAKRAKRRSSAIKVTHADGRVELRKANAFHKRKGSTRRRDYRAYLRSPHWRRTRKEALIRAEGRCEECGEAKRRLEVHHKTYERLGAELPEDLLVLCQDCHPAADRKRRALEAARTTP
jgi:5-methylcytosine-specific restriction endonuclease McrA